MNNSVSELPPFPGQADQKAEEPQQSSDRDVTAEHYDEIRRALRELASRQLRLESLLRACEGDSGDNRSALEQFRQDVEVATSARAVDDRRIKQQVSELEQRLDDASRPIRALQAQVKDIVEDARYKVEDTEINQKRYEQLKSSVDHLQAVGERGIATGHQLRDSIEAMQRDVENVRKSIQGNEDSIKVVDQDSRRRTKEIADSSSSVNDRIDELQSDLNHTFELIEDAKRSTEHLDPAIEELRQADTHVDQSISRINQQAVERHDVLATDVDAIKESMEAQFAEVRQIQDQRIERVNERIDEVGGHYRELETRVEVVAAALNELRLTDDALRRDLWDLHEQRVRLRLEQAQHEMEQVSGMKRGEVAGHSKSTRSIARPADR